MAWSVLVMSWAVRDPSLGWAWTGLGKGCAVHGLCWAWALLGSVWAGHSLDMG